MCGYCTESGIFAYLEAYPNLDDDLAQIPTTLPMSPALEIDPWEDALKTSDSVSATIILTRIYSQFFTKGFCQELVDRFNSTYSETEIRELFKPHSQSLNTVYSDTLFAYEAFQNEAVWNHRLFSQSDKTWCPDLLASYISLLREPNIYEELSVEENELYEKIVHGDSLSLMFSLFFTMSVEPNSQNIKDIALRSIPVMPWFDAVELYLQRTAYLHCVRTYGMQFMLDNYEQTRLPLIWFVIIKENLSDDQLMLLRERVNQNLTLQSESISAEDLLEIIDEKMKSGINCL